MTNRLSLRAPSLLRNQSGNSSTGYLIVAVAVGLAGVSSLTAFGGASGLAIADKAASAATALPMVGDHAFAGLDEGGGTPSPTMEVGIAPGEVEETSIVEAGTSVLGALGEQIGGIDEDGKLTVNGKLVASVSEDGITFEKGAEILADGTVMMNGSAAGIIDPQTGAIYAIEGEDEDEATELVAGSKADENTRANEPAAGADGNTFGGPKKHGKGLRILGAVALGAAAAVAGVMGAPVVAAGLAIVAGLSLFNVNIGGGASKATDDVAVAQEEAAPESTPSEVAPENGALDGQAPLMSLESLGLTNLVDPPYQFEEDALTSDPSTYVFQRLGLSPEDASMLGEDSEYYRNRSYPITYADGSMAFVSLQLTPTSQDGTTWQGLAVVTDEEGNELLRAPISSESSPDWASNKIDVYDVNEDGSMGDATTVLDARFEQEGNEGFFVFKTAQGDEQRSEAYPVGQGYEQMTEYLVHENFAMMLAARVKPDVEIKAVGDLQENFEVSEVVDGKKQTLLLEYGEQGTSVISIDRSNGHVGEWQFARTGETDADGFPIEKLVGVRAAKMPEE